MDRRLMLAATRVPGWRIIKAGAAAAAAAALAAGLGGGAQASTASPDGGPGIAATAPARAAGSHANLYGVSCKGRSFCMAIGTYTRPGHPSVRLAEEWNGRRWRSVPDPLTGILAWVTCGSPSFCFAQRDDVPGVNAGTPDLAEWNGRTWHSLKNQPPDSGVVSCLTPTLCMLHAPLQPTVIAAWNGSTWQNMPGSNVCDGTPPGTECGWNSFTCGNGPSCVGSDFSCVTTDCPVPLTGTAAFTAAGGWDLAAGLPFVPGGAACAGRSFCLITSGTTAEAAQNADSRTWRNVTPDLAVVCHGAANCTLAGAILSCGYPGVCMAFPRYAAITLALNGTTWAAAPLAPVHGRIPQLTAMSCGSARNCAAVGSYQRTPGGPTLTIAEHWNGKTWQVTPTPGT